LPHLENDGFFLRREDFYEPELRALGPGNCFDDGLGPPTLSVKDLTCVARLQSQDSMKVNGFSRRELEQIDLGRDIRVHIKTPDTGK